MTDPLIPPDQDAWPLIAQFFDKALADARGLLEDPRGLVELAEARYREGERLYKRDWLTRPEAWFDSEAAQEAADLVVYLAMRYVLIEAKEQAWR